MGILGEALGGRRVGTLVSFHSSLVPRRKLRPKREVAGCRSLAGPTPTEAGLCVLPGDGHRYGLQTILVRET